MVKILNMGKATSVVPELQYVLDKIATKKPLFVFEASELSDVYAGEQMTMSVRGVNVTCDAEIVGSIEHRVSGGRVGSDGSAPDAFLIESVHIKK